MQSYISYSKALGTGLACTLCMHPICKICMREVMGSNPTVSIEHECLLVWDFLSIISSIRTKYVIEPNGAEGDHNVIQRGFARGAHVTESRVCCLNKMAGAVGSMVRALAGKYVATSQLLDYFVKILICDGIYSYSRWLNCYSREATPAFWVSR